MSEKKRLPRLITPEGVARFPSLVRADTRFNPEGDYKVDLRIHPDKAAEFISELEEIRDKFLQELPEKDRKKAKIKPVYTVETDDEDNETGFYLFKLKQQAIVKSKEGKVYNMRPRFFDANNDPIDDKVVDELRIWGGSILVAQVEVKAYQIQTDKTVGVSLRPKCIQLIKVVSGGGDSPFAKREGYAAPKAEKMPTQDERPQADGSDADDDIPF